MVGPTPGAVYRTPDGLPTLYVRTEDDAWVFAFVRDRVIFTRRYAVAHELPGEFEPVDDRAGRETAEACFAELERIERERDAYLAALKYATPLLPPTAAEETRRIYREALAA